MSYPDGCPPASTCRRLSEERSAVFFPSSFFRLFPFYGIIGRDDFFVKGGVPHFPENPRLSFPKHGLRLPGQYPPPNGRDLLPRRPGAG